MNIITDQELKAHAVVAFVMGAALAAATAAVLHYRVFDYLAPPEAAPQIVKATPNVTVARIPTQHAGVRIDCTVTIDQAKNVWSITC